MIGGAQRGPLDDPILTTSPANYVDTFGEPIPEDYGSYAALEFLRRGNQLFYIRVAEPTAAFAFAELFGGQLMLRAKERGTYSHNISASVILSEEQNLHDDFELTIYRNNMPEERFIMNLNPNDENYIENHTSWLVDFIPNIGKYEQPEILVGLAMSRNQDLELDQLTHAIGRPMQREFTFGTNVRVVQATATWCDTDMEPLANYLHPFVNDPTNPTGRSHGLTVEVDPDNYQITLKTMEIPQPDEPDEAPEPPEPQVRVRMPIEIGGSTVPASFFNRLAFTDGAANVDDAILERWENMATARFDMSYIFSNDFALFPQTLSKRVVLGFRSLGSVGQRLFAIDHSSNQDEYPSVAWNVLANRTFSYNRGNGHLTGTPVVNPDYLNWQHPMIPDPAVVNPYPSTIPNPEYLAWTAPLINDPDVTNPYPVTIDNPDHFNWQRPMIPDPNAVNPYAPTIPNQDYADWQAAEPALTIPNPDHATWEAAEPPTMVDNPDHAQWVLDEPATEIDNPAHAIWEAAEPAAMIHNTAHDTWAADEPDLTILNTLHADWSNAEPTEPTEPTEPDATDYPPGSAEHDQWLLDHAQWVTEHATWVTEHAQWVTEEPEEFLPNPDHTDWENNEPALEVVNPEHTAWVADEPDLLIPNPAHDVWEGDEPDLQIPNQAHADWEAEEPATDITNPDHTQWLTEQPAATVPNPDYVGWVRPEIEDMGVNNPYPSFKLNPEHQAWVHPQIPNPHIPNPHPAAIANPEHYNWNHPMIQDPDVSNPYPQTIIAGPSTDRLHEVLAAGNYQGYWGPVNGRDLSDPARLEWGPTEFLFFAQRDGLASIEVALLDVSGAVGSSTEATVIKRHIIDVVVDDAHNRPPVYPEDLGNLCPDYNGAPPSAEWGPEVRYSVMLRITGDSGAISTERVNVIFSLEQEHLLSFEFDNTGEGEGPFWINRFPRLPETPLSVELTGGHNGLPVTAARIIRGLQMFRNVEDLDLNILAAPGHYDRITLTQLIDIAESRADSIAILDPPPGLNPQNIVRWHNGTLARWGPGMREEGMIGAPMRALNSSYAALFYPWVTIANVFDGTEVWVPPSGVICGAIAHNDRVGQPWFAPAGLNRGMLQTVLSTERPLDEGSRDHLYGNGNAINPIVNYHRQGIVIWGQRTLQRKTSALDRINVRRLMNLIRKSVALTTAYLLFEQNDELTWRRWVGIISPFMEMLKQSRAMYDYRVVMDATTVTPFHIDRNQMPGQIWIKPTRVAEFIPIDFIITSTGAVFQELM
jgi:hypothetical protein